MCICFHCQLSIAPFNIPVLVSWISKYLYYIIIMMRMLQLEKKKALLYRIGSWDYGGWKVPRSVVWVSKLETQVSQWYSSSPEAGRIKAQDFNLSLKTGKSWCHSLKAVGEKELCLILGTVKLFVLFGYLID